MPLLSANMIENINIDANKDKVKYFNGVDHTGMASQDEPISWAVDILKNNASDRGELNPSNGKPYIVIRIACPVDVKISKDNEVINSSVKEKSTSTSYGNLNFLGENNDIKIIDIDEATDYNINLKGTGNGTMNYKITWYDGKNNEVDKRDFLNVPITETTTISTGTDKNSDTTLNIDNNNDGNVDSIWKSESNSTGTLVESAKLSKLSLSNVDLTPIFSKDIFEYKSVVKQAVKDTNLELAVDDKSVATIKVNDDSEYKYDKISNIGLKDGENLIRIKVEAPNALPSEYIIKIKRDYSNNEVIKPETPNNSNGNTIDSKLDKETITQTTTGLPSTGGVNTRGVLLLGFLLVVIGGIFMIKKSNLKSKKENSDSF